MPRLTMADMPDEVKALVSGDLSAGINDTVSVGNYLTFNSVQTQPTVSFTSITLGGDFIAGGRLNVASLPTSDPHVAGDLWNDNGTPKISAG